MNGAGGRSEVRGDWAPGGGNEGHDCTHSGSSRTAFHPPRAECYSRALAAAYGAVSMPG